MSNTYKKRLIKIFNKLNKLALKGKDNYNEYSKYINELVDKGNYSEFEDVLLIYYEIDITKERDIESYKKKSWKSICEGTKSSFLYKLTDIYKSKEVYQMSFYIHRNSNGEVIGEIRENEVVSDNFDYYIKNSLYSRLMGDLKTYLLVRKNSDLDYTLIEDNDSNLSEEDNLLNRYKLAIDYLLS